MGVKHYVCVFLVLLAQRIHLDENDEMICEEAIMSGLRQQHFTFHLYLLKILAIPYFIVCQIGTHTFYFILY